MEKMEFNNLDKFLRDQVEASEFPMQEAHWQKAADLISLEEEKQKKPFLFWRGLSLLAILLISGIIAFVMPNWKNSKTTQKKHTTAQGKVADNAVKENNIIGNKPQTFKPIKQDNKNKRNRIAEEVNSDANTEQSILQSNRIVTIENTSAALITNNENSKKYKWRNARNYKVLNKNSSSLIVSNTTENKMAKQEMSTNAPNDNSDTKMVSEVLPPNEVKDKKSLGTNNIKKSTNKKLIQANVAVEQSKNIEKYKMDGAIIMPIEEATRPLSQENKLVKKVQPKNAKEFQKIKKSNKGLVAESKTYDTELQTIEDKNLEQINKNRIVQNKTPIPTKANGKPVVYSKSNRDETVYNPRYLHNAKEKMKIEPLVKTEKNILDSNQNTENIIASLPSNANYKKNIWWTIQAGMFANKGFKGNIDTFTNFGLAPYFTTGIKKELSSRLTLNTQIGATYYNALNTEKVAPNIRYSFGSDSALFTVQYKKIMQLYAPITLAYKIKRHELLAGIGVSYMLDVQSKVQATPNEPAKNTFGYRTGFNPLDIMVHAGYAYRIDKDLQITAQYSKGFVDATKNNYFNNTLSNMQSKFSVGINYHLKKLNKKK
jgi:hypothetical protein